MKLPILLGGNRSSVAGIAALAFMLGLTTVAEADVTRILITRVESPTFGGVSFGEVGQYEKLVGRAFGEVDPHDPRNAVIVDLTLAPRNVRGMVEYSTDIYILKPVDSNRGNHRLFFELGNRGNLLSFGRMNDFLTVGNDPTTAADAGSGFLMREGYTVVTSGWDVSVAPGGGRQTITVPIAKNLDGSSIVGPALEEFAFDNATTIAGALAYPAATLDKSRASLTVRVHYTDPVDVIPATGWEYVNDRSIRLLPAGKPFEQSKLYEFTYTAKDPTVAGLGFAATRDVAAFLHRAAEDLEGSPNPLAGDVRFVYSLCNSQSCRFMHDFLQLGFNEDEHGQPGLRRSSQLGWSRQPRVLQLSVCSAWTKPLAAHRSLVSGAALSVHRRDSLRPGHREDRRLASPLSGNEHVPEDLRGRIGKRGTGPRADHFCTRTRSAGILTIPGTSGCTCFRACPTWR